MPSTSPFTSVISLDNEPKSTQIPSCARIAENSSGKLQEVYSAINEARRVVVLCGAGISVYAGIPDFRSSGGLFQSLKRDHPKENITSGRDLFDSAVFKVSTRSRASATYDLQTLQSEETTALFYKMISHLATLSETAQPTPFHSMLQSLDARGQLLRVYTQNIDALEERVGLTFGIPTFPPRARKRKAAAPSTVNSPTPVRARSSSSDLSPAPSPPPQLSTPPRSANSSAMTSPSQTPVPTPQLPRCVPLHGTLQNLYCPSCHLTLPLCTPEHLETLRSGNPLACPQCAELDGTRRLVGKRTRGVARLRPGVVLYNEPHREGEAERVGECVRRDLIGLGSGQLSRAGSARKKRGDDLLIVAGTSLRIPGAKRIVREFAKALHPVAEPSNHAQARTSMVKTVYLNLDFPVPAREWDGVFDVWIQGDVQSFALGFKEYQAELERGFPSAGASTPTNARVQNHNSIRTKPARTPTDAGTRRKRAPGGPSLEPMAAGSIKKSKRKVSPSPYLHPSSVPSHSSYQPNHRTRTTSNPIKKYPGSTPRLTIKIKPKPRTAAAPTTPSNSTRPSRQLPQEMHSIVPDPGFLPTLPSADVNQRPGRRSMLPPVMSKIAT
ncbi:hypothetical protein FRC06_005598 [Ceratobasidium sp. 370]|nr:hypothetical protein FRC06_005598 [Ceratobasidium sp. 370]